MVKKVNWECNDCRSKFLYCSKCMDNERKQGALEELKKLKNIGFKSKDSLGLMLEFEKYVHKRIEELEKKKEMGWIKND